MDLGLEITVGEPVEGRRDLGSRAQHAAVHIEQRNAGAGQQRGEGRNPRVERSGLCMLQGFFGRCKRIGSNQRGGVFEQLGRRPINTLDGPVPGARLEAGIDKGLVAGPVGLPHGLVFVNELDQQVARRGRWHTPEQHGTGLLDTRFLLFELAPVLKPLFLVGAAQQDVLPFLHLFLECRHHAADVALGIELVRRQVPEMIDRGRYAQVAERHGRYDQQGHAADNDEEFGFETVHQEVQSLSHAPMGTRFGFRKSWRRGIPKLDWPVDRP